MTLRENLQALLDLLFPRTCVVCGRVLDRSEVNICAHCLGDVPHTYYWSREHNPMADRFNECIQRHVEASLDAENLPDAPEMYAFAMALFFYKSGSDYREITKSLKYRGDFGTGRMFARELAMKIREAAFLADADLIVPVPLHWTRRWKRGYNQAEVIAEVLSRELGIPCETSLLQRTRRTKTQTKLGVEQKGKNVSGAFAVKPGSVCEARHVILVDDVCTTGSTLSECHWALRQALGPQVRISAVTLACVGS
ncbi:MAG: ComF family protein [Bacteroidales bacterium]|nr:ComF family protein [Bacteroidales bacterium]